MSGPDLVGKRVEYMGQVGLVLRPATAVDHRNFLLVQADQTGAEAPLLFAIPESEWTAVEVLEGKEASAGARKAVVLFLCTGNSARSQMAEGLLRAKAGDRVVALSAGTHPRPLRGEAIEVMRELGIDISGQRSKDVGEYLGKIAIDHLITLSDIANAECGELLGVEHHLHWSIEDPALAAGNYFELLDVFRRLRDELASRIDRFLVANPPPPRGPASRPHTPSSGVLG